MLGDIDGSGIPTIAVGINGVLYVKATTELPQSGIWRMVPDGTGPASVAEPAAATDIPDLTEQTHHSRTNTFMTHTGKEK